MVCVFCEEPIKEGDDFMAYKDQRGHLCCYIGDLVFELDNTLMCNAVVGTGQADPRAALRQSFKQTLSTWRCSHGGGRFQAWPWGSR